MKLFVQLCKNECNAIGPEKITVIFTIDLLTILVPGLARLQKYESHSGKYATYSFVFISDLLNSVITYKY